MSTFGEKNMLSLKRCRRCHTIFYRAPQNAAALEGIYENYYNQASFTLLPAAAESLERLVEAFERFRVHGRILDVGYGEGGLLTIAGRRGWSCYGSDLSPQALEYGKAQGWTVGASLDDDTQFPTNGFDIVTMIEFIEHVPHPGEFLDSAARLLRSEGLLYLTTPNARSLNSRLLGCEWSVFSPPEHLIVWSAAGVRSALRRSGFEPFRIRTTGLNPYEILSRGHALRPGASPAPPMAAERNSTSFQLNATFSGSSLRRGVKAAINQGLTALEIGDSLKVWAIRRT
jgi:SAM-dependent methyltransferase